MEIRKLEGLKKIGMFKANLDDIWDKEKSFHCEPKEEGVLYSDEKGNMIPALELYIPNSYWEELTVLKYVLVIPEEDVYEIQLDEDMDDHRKDYLEIMQPTSCLTVLRIPGVTCTNQHYKHI